MSNLIFLIEDLHSVLEVSTRTQFTEVRFLLVQEHNGTLCSFPVTRKETQVVVKTLDVLNHTVQTVV